LAYNIVFKRSVSKDLKRLGTHVAGRVLDKIESELSRAPERFPALRGPFAGLRKCRIGDYRVIYIVTGGDVIVLRICHRREAYR